MVSGVLHDTMEAQRQVEQSSGTLTAETTGAVGHVQFQDITRQMLEHVVDAVGQIKQGADDVLGYAEGSVPAQAVLERTVSIDDFRDRYVMSRQRATYGEHAGGTAVASDDTPAIELF